MRRWIVPGASPKAKYEPLDETAVDVMHEVVSSLNKVGGGKEKGERDTHMIEVGGVGVGNIDDVDKALSRGDDEAGCMHWKQVDERRAVGEGDRREGFHVAEIVDLYERIGIFVAAST